MGLLLAAVGLFAVLSCGVAEQRRELGVRAALGAGRGRLLGRVLAHGLTVTAVGLVLGLGLAAASTRLLEGLLFGVTPLDPLAFARWHRWYCCCRPPRPASCRPGARHGSIRYRC